jgi:hypothetical protein
MNLPVIASFENKATGERVAGLVSRTTFEDVLLQGQWAYSDDAQDRGWNWADIWLAGQTMPRHFECYSARIGREVHGLMSLDLRGRTIRGNRALVVEYLATNPSDRQREQGFKYIGVCLMAVAVTRSLELGMAGRLWLESLPDPRTLQFYQTLGMRKLRRRSADGYDVFVFAAGPAVEFLNTAINEQWLDLENR